jgi:hypothetical protein
MHPQLKGNFADAVGGFDGKVSAEDEGHTGRTVSEGGGARQGPVPMRGLALLNWQTDSV